VRARARCPCDGRPEAGATMTHLPQRSTRVDNTTKRAWGGFFGQIPTTWISGQRSRTAPSRNAAEAAARAQERSAAVGPRPWPKACESSGNSCCFTMCAMWDRAAGCGEFGRRPVPEMWIRVALVQAVHVLRSREPVRVHAAGERADREKGRA
jgi:hypothetical protein